MTYVQRARLGKDSRFRANGFEWVVTEQTRNGDLVCRRLGSEPTEVTLSLAAIVAASDYRVLSVVAPDALELARTLGQPLDELATHVQEQAKRRFYALQRVRTGYRFGSAELALEGEPWGRLMKATERYEIVMAELGVRPARFYELLKLYDEGAPIAAFADGRATRKTEALARCPQVLQDAIRQVAHTYRHRTRGKARVTLKVKRQETLALLRRNPETAHMQVSQKAFNKYYKALTKGEPRKSPTKYQRSWAAVPPPPYGQIDATRHDQFVLMDSTSSNTFVVHPVTFEPVVPEIIVCQSAFTRSVPAIHVVYARPTQVDACLVYRKLVYPTVMAPEWPDEARWPYHGVPEAIVIGLMRPDAKRLAGIPPANPSVLITDNAWIYHSMAFRDNVRSYGGSVQFARTWTPTDKAMLERTQGLIDKQLFALLAGYRGPDVHSSAVNAHIDDLMWHDDFEALILEWVARSWQQHDHGGLFFGVEPHMGVTPNDMFERSVAEYGFTVPINRDGRYLSLPRILVDVTNKGITWGDWVYESDDLAYFRDKNRRGGSPWAHLGRKWPVRFNPEDVTTLHIQNDNTGEWFEIPWKGRRLLNRPFSLDGRDAIRHIARKRGRRPRTEQQILEFALEVIERREAMREVRRKTAEELREKAFGKTDPPLKDNGAVTAAPTASQLRPLAEITRRGAMSDSR